MEYKKVTYALSNLNVKPNTTGGAVPTTIEIGVVGDASDIDIVTKAIADMVAANEKCNGFVDLKNSTSTSVSKKVLLLGSGMVAMPVLRHLCSIEGVHLTIASDQEAQALDMINQIDGHAEKLQYMPFNYPQDLEKINRKIGDVDLVISLLPATMHTTFAEMAIKHRRHMVTASYVSDAMQALDQPAKDAGVIIMNGKCILWSICVCVFAFAM